MFVPANYAPVYVFYNTTVHTMTQSISFNTNKTLALIQTNNHWTVQQPIRLVYNKTPNRFAQSNTKFCPSINDRMFFQIFVIVIVKTINWFKIKVNNIDILG